MQTNQLLTADQLAELFSVTRGTVLRWHREGRLPAPIKCNERVLRWAAADLTAWMQQQRQTAPDSR